jgi:hypothetical protein
LNYGAGLFLLQMNFIELQLHYLNCGRITVHYLDYSKIAAAFLALRMHYNVSFGIAAEDFLKIHILTDKTLIKKSPTDHYIYFEFLPPQHCF